MRKLLVLSFVLLITSCSNSSKTQPSTNDLNFFSKNNNAKIATVTADCYADWNNGDDSNPGTDVSPKKHIQNCINAVSNGQTVIAKPGTYVENINFNGKNITVASSFINTGDPNDILNTIIDGNQNGSVVTIASGENSNTTLTGFTIQNGNAVNGGGIYISGNALSSSGFSTTPKLSYLKITSNTASGYGGGIYIMDTAISANYIYNNLPILMENLEVINNNAISDGGGIYATRAVITLKRTKLSGNISNASGGAIRLLFIDVVGDLDKLYITNNRARYYAGGSIGPSWNNFQTPSNIRITNSLVANNVASVPKDLNCSYGNACGGLYVQMGESDQILKSKLDIINCTFTDNKTKSNEGGGLCILTPSAKGEINVINSVFWGNTKWYEADGMTEEPIQILLYGIPYTPYVNLAYNDIQNLTSTGVFVSCTYPNVQATPASIFLAGNIDSDPLFVDQYSANYSIKANSPCAGVGVNSITIGGQNIVAPIDDIIFTARPMPLGTNVDVGAYEITQKMQIQPAPFTPRPGSVIINKPHKPVHL